MALITLRKALRLKKKIEDKTRDSAPSFNIVVDIDSKAALEISNHFLSEEAKYVSSIKDAVRTSDILSKLRDNIDKSNTTSGVNTLLAKIAHIDRQLNIFKDISTAKPSDIDLLSNKIDRKKSAAALGLKSEVKIRFSQNIETDTTVSACVLSQEVVEDYASKMLLLRKEREALEDERLGLNNTPQHAVEISDDDIEFLNGIGIV